MTRTAGVPHLAAATVTRTGLAPAWSVTGRRGVGNFGIQAQLKEIE